METAEQHCSMTGDLAPEPAQAEADQIKMLKEDSDSDEGLGACLRQGERKGGSRTRRGRRKAYKPYYQLSEGERGVREERERLRLAKLQERMWARGRMIAPYNTTQFLMGDQHEENYYLSSPTTDDQEFMSQEFRKEYEVHNMNRLEKMSKEMLLNEYMMLERKNEKLEEKLKTINKQEEVKEKISKSEYAARARKLQSELTKLKLENKRLLAENLEMKKRLNSSNESESGEESSEESSASSSSSSSEADLESLIEDKQKSCRELPSSDDPGYESNQSKSDVK